MAQIIANVDPEELERADAKINDLKIELAHWKRDYDRLSDMYEELAAEKDMWKQDCKWARRKVAELESRLEGLG